MQPSPLHLRDAYPGGPPRNLRKSLRGACNDVEERRFSGLPRVAEAPSEAEGEAEPAA
jgi:hypothetical protein